MRAPRLLPTLALLPFALVTGCTGQQPAVEPAPKASATPPSSSPSSGPSVSAPAATAVLPDGPLRELVPAPGEVPAGLEPVVAGSGPRDVGEVAAFSADPSAASRALSQHGFRAAYVAQYASRTDLRSLTVVAVRFADADGARADLDGDVAATGGTAVDAPTIGDASDVRRLELPDDEAAELLTVRFRKGPTTWLVAWRATRPADADVPLEIARALADRG
ncbi:MAG TPA: hypothetical protein VNU26_14380 [Mycobacteriales bacterium]|nr:hypothetical protein [Mycobacteriales bacterium]